MRRIDFIRDVSECGPYRFANNCVFAEMWTADEMVVLREKHFFHCLQSY